MGAPSKLPGNKSIKTGGRPTVYTDKLGQKICSLKARGISIDRMCRTYPDLPDPTTIGLWIAENRFPAFSHMYRRASAVCDELMADGLIDLADAPVAMQRTERETKDGRIIVEERIDAGAVNQLKHRLGVRQWWLSRRMPERFGDFLHLIKKEETKHTIRFEIEVPGFLAGRRVEVIEADATPDDTPPMIEAAPKR